MHGVFRTFGRKIGSGRVPRAVAKATAEQGAVARRNMPTATPGRRAYPCLGSRCPTCRSRLPAPELEQFVTCSAPLLVAHYVVG